MQKNTFIGSAFLLVIVVGITFYAATKPVPAKAPSEVAALLPAGSYSEHAQYYDIVANYASSTPLIEPANTTAITLMQKFVSDTIEQFKTDGNFANLTAADIKTLGFDQGRKETLQVTYLIASSGRTISYIFTTYEDTLGAHGNLFFHTFTFDRASGAPLTLASIFSSTTYLDTLSSLARAKLPGVIGKDADMMFIKDGTEPEEENFENFFFDNAQLVFLFPPYQVGPYSAGPQTLRIPVAELSSVLKSDYR